MIETGHLSAGCASVISVKVKNRVASGQGREKYSKKK